MRGRHFVGIALTAALWISVASDAAAQQLAAHISNRDTPPNAKPENALLSTEVVERLLAAELETRNALTQHSFNRDVLIQSIGRHGEVTGEYIRKSQFVLDDKGNRVERVLHHPRSTLKDFKISKEDVQDLAGTQLLGLDYWESSKYYLTFVGLETVDGRKALAVDIKPVQKPNPHQMRNRYFVGRIWIDPATHQIILVRGRTEPQGKQRFPQFETRRETRSGSHLFPSSTFADDFLYFPGRTARMRITVRYYDYRRFRSSVNITEVDEPEQTSLPGMRK